MTQTEVVVEQPVRSRRSPGLTALAAAGIVVAAGSIASAVLSRQPSLESWMKAWWPFVVLAVSVGVIVTLITVAKLHAFLALILAAIGAGLMSRVGTLPGAATDSHWVKAVELTTAGLGSVAGNIGVVIVLASVIGVCLLESGAADKIVRRFLALFGVKRAGLALLISTYIVSIPIFFDTIFMLLLPLAKALRLRTGGNYLLYLMAICCAGSITHSLVIPHPGPLAMAAELRIDAGLTIGVGLLSGLVPMFVGWLFVLWLNRRMEVAMVEEPGSGTADLEEIIRKEEGELPALWLSLLPILLPVLLISAASTVTALQKSGVPGADYLAWMNFVGNRNIALIIGSAIAVGLVMRQRRIGLARVGELIGPPLETAGVIILITAAGGAFGTMLRNAGLSDAIKSAAAGHEVNLILLAYLVALVIRVAQGSATVAMLTTSAMIYPLMSGTPLPYHPVYIFIAIGYGAMGVSWMNDSGFWVISRLSGMGEKQTLKSWTILVSIISVTGLLTALIGSRLLPFAPAVVAPPGQ